MTVLEPGDVPPHAATLAEVRARFDAAGYRLEFEAADGQLWCRGCGQRAHPADVVIEAVAPVAPSHESPAGDLYALDCLTCGIKGVWWVARDGPDHAGIVARLRRARRVGAPAPLAAVGRLVPPDEQKHFDLDRPDPAPTLTAISSVLAVFAHPDDESFGLGAVLDSLVDAGVDVAGLCFTHGEASTLGEAGVDLHSLRAAELAEAAAALAIGAVDLLDYPDGGLSDVSIGALVERVIDAGRRHHADLLVVFDEGGITGHPDHQQATRAALAAADRLGLPVVAWAVTDTVATTLNGEFGSSFVGRGPDEVDLTVAVDRRRQLAAIACHRSQSSANPVLWRRLELTGNREPLRWLRPGPSGLPLRLDASLAADVRHLADQQGPLG